MKCGHKNYDYNHEKEVIISRHCGEKLVKHYDTTPLKPFTVIPIMF